MTDRKLALPLTPTMRAALAYMKLHGGKLIRYPGGFWIGAGESPTRGGGLSTPTVNALERRGLIKFVEYKLGRHWRFPVAATLK